MLLKVWKLSEKGSSFFNKPGSGHIFSFNKRWRESLFKKFKKGLSYIHAMFAEANPKRTPVIQKPVFVQIGCCIWRNWKRWGGFIKCSFWRNKWLIRISTVSDEKRPDLMKRKKFKIFHQNILLTRLIYIYTYIFITYRLGIFQSIRFFYSGFYTILLRKITCWKKRHLNHLNLNKIKTPRGNWMMELQER